MKLRTCLGATTLLALGTMTLAGAAPAAGAPPDPWQKPFDATIDNQQPADNALIELARAADVNFILDATQAAKAPVDTPLFRDPLFGPMPKTVATQLYRVTRAGDLSTLKTDAGLMLLWPRPDIAALARDIVAARAAAPEAPPDVHPIGFMRPRPAALLARMSPAMRENLYPRDPLRVTLRDYLQQNIGWDGATGKIFPVNIPLSDFPRAMRHEIIDRVGSFHGMSKSRPAAVISDQAWENARFYFRYSKPREDGSVTASLIVFCQDDTASTMKAVAIWREPAPEVNHEN